MFKTQSTFTENESMFWHVQKYSITTLIIFILYSSNIFKGHLYTLYLQLRDKSILQVLQML